MKKPQNNDLTDEYLDDLIELATVDCYDDEECEVGLQTYIEDEVEVPFPAKVIWETVTVTGFRQSGERFLAVIKKNNAEHSVDVLDLEYKPEDVLGSEWIEAYRKWKGE